MNNKVKQGRRLLGVTVVVLLVAALTIAPPASADPKPRTDVCHVQNNGSAQRHGRNPQTGVLKQVKTKQLAQHIAHGDGLPGDPVPGLPGYAYDGTCVIVAIDSDFDGVPDLFDVCPGFDDLVDTDGGGIPDGCEVILKGDDDGDGVDNASDLCPGFDDFVDTDRDGIPDGCDATPNGDPPDDCGGFANIQVQSDVALYDECAVLDGVYVHITGAVTDVTLPLLTTVNTYVYFHQNSGLASVSMPQLTSVGDYVYFHQNPAVQSVDMGALSTVGQYLYFHENTQLDTLQLNSLTSVNDYVYFVGNTSLCPPSLTWPVITSGSVTIAGNKTPCP